MSNIKFYNDRYWRFKYDFKDFIIDKKRSNHSIEKENISLSVLKGYNLFCSYQKGNEENNKENPIGIRLLYYF